MNKVISNFKLLEKEDFIDYSDDIELIFVELPKFNKGLNELSSITDKWIYFVKHAGEMDFIPAGMEKELKSAFEIILSKLKNNLTVLKNILQKIIRRLTLNIYLK